MFYLNPVQERALRKIFCHIDGISMGSTIDALYKNGVLTRLSEARIPLSINQTADEFGARRGYFHVAMRLLACQGFIRIRVSENSGTLSMLPTPAGQRFAEKASKYKQVSSLIHLALQIDRFPDGETPLVPNLQGGLHSITPGPSGIGEIDRMITLHLQGHLVGPIMKTLCTRHFFETFGNVPEKFLPLRDFNMAPEILSIFLEILAEQGWVKREKTSVCLTTEGVIAGNASPQYFHPVSYLPLFQRVSHLLFGKGTSRLSVRPEGIETHLDREADIAFSGIVFKKSCLRPFLNIVLPIFDALPLHAQPAAVVDTGAGDGTLLIELFRAIREKTLRGKALEQYPLAMVGVEYNRIAKETCARKLRQVGLPGLTLSGDIADPAGIAEGLKSADINPLNVLHVSKSVIHNRRYVPPKNTDAAQAWNPVSRAVFTDEDGNLVPRASLEYNLIEFFQSWIPWTQRHGMVVIEAHTIDPALVSTHIGYSVVPALEATHGYSNQYLMEREAFERIAAAAGCETLANTGIGSEILAHPLLTIHYFKTPQEGFEG